ncbi:MAG: histidine kinase [Candidatus Muproteobacteria bacterium RBG_19FT_COMBO_61_10]|jgi:CBS domain-containing protein|uniref:Histidine kinase n=1 Tax=Candidatus Muproteobacteria bacterium RBG_19FT_COMBO_61_10 TaxID=1817761 RepID=A0A1F6UIQ5_9PROT|nr:MAG: histidine kinase [Candidatus Muproteobacteria bacterium RBG_19FT_COMBO_61_10]
MPIGEICNREVIFATRANTITEAAELMRHHHVGDLVVVEEKSGQRVPVGMLTDRDLVIEILAKNVTLGDVTVGDIMSVDLVAARETDGIYETIQLMRAKGIRRLPVVNPRGGLEGIVSVDDLLELLAEEISGLARLVSREQQREKKTRP